MMSSTADAFTESYTAAGGRSTIVRLPEEGVTGNSHFLFQELNNDVIAEHMEAWIRSNTGENNISRPVSQAPAVSENETKGSKTLVAYYSATSNTAAVAGALPPGRWTPL